MFSRPQQSGSKRNRHNVRIERLEDRLPFAVGDLDISFGSAGIVRDAVLQTRNSGENVRQLIPRSDGGFYLAGDLLNGRGYSGAVWSFKNDGTLQTSFGNGGQATVPFASGDEHVTSASLQPDGKILISGYFRNTQIQANSQGIVRRLNTDGSIDTAFGTNGQFVYSNVVHAAINHTVVRPTGEIVLLTRSFGSYDLIQLKSNGQIDTNFVSNGVLSEPTESTPDDLLLLSDGSLLVASVVAPDSLTREVIIVKHKSNGDRDMTFGNNGQMRLTVAEQLQSNSYPTPLHMRISNDGAVLLAGTKRLDDTSNFFVAKFTTLGSLVNSFGSSGVATIALNGLSGTGLHDIQVNSNGRIAVFGNYYSGSATVDSGLLVKYLTSAGQIDATAASGGTLTITNSFGNDSGFAGFAGNRLIHAMSPSIFDIEKNDIQLLAFNSNGAIDTTFGTAGKIIFNAETKWARSETHDIIQLADDSYLALSANSIDRQPNGLQPMLVRYRHDGTIDTNYGTGGRVLLTNDAVNTFYFPMRLIQTTQGIYLALQENLSLRIAKLTADYKLDSSFGTQGWLTWNASGTLDAFHNVLLTSDAIYVAGRTTMSVVNGVSLYPSAVAKLNWQGVLDTSFGSSGLVSFPTVSAATSNIQLAIQSTGKLLVMLDNHQADPLFSVRMVRLLSNGNIDSSFGNQGSRTTQLMTGAAIDRHRKIEVLNDDSLIVFGVDSTQTSGVATFSKYDANGNLDTSFGTSGTVKLAPPDLLQELYDLRIDSENRIVVAVGAVSAQSTGTLVARYLPDGKVDNEFSQDGQTVFTLTPFSDALNRMLISDRDDIVLAGKQVSLKSTDALAVRLTGSEPDPVDWHNQWTAEDVSGDRLVTAIDALLLVNRLNTQTTSAVPSVKNDAAFLDVNDDGFITSLDALLVVNYLNNRGGGEGESNVTASATANAISDQFALNAGTLDPYVASLSWVDEAERLKRARSR